MVAATIAYILEITIAQFFIRGRGHFVAGYITLISIFFYPLSAFAITSLGLRSKYLVLGLYLGSQTIKILFYFMVEAVINEVFNQIRYTKLERKEENYRAISTIFGNLVSMVVFLIGGFTITYMFSMKRIIALDPYHYVVAMVIIPILFAVVYVSIALADLFASQRRQSIRASQRKSLQLGSS